MNNNNSKPEFDTPPVNLSQALDKLLLAYCRRKKIIAQQQLEKDRFDKKTQNT